MRAQRRTVFINSISPSGGEAPATRRPVSRCFPLALMIAAGCTGLLGGCEKLAHAWTAASPDASFEARCASLPTAEVVVVHPVPEVIERSDLPFAALASMQPDRSDAHRTVGLTQVELRHATQIEYAGLQDRRGRACVRPRVRVELRLEPLTVFVASEYDGDPCREPIIRAHEQRHVEVYARYAAEAAPRLQESLAATIGTEPRFGAPPEAAQRAVDTQIQAALSQFMRDSERILSERNAEVDTPDQYDALARACGPTQ